LSKKVGDAHTAQPAQSSREELVKPLRGRLPDLKMERLIHLLICSFVQWVNEPMNK
jgi:hypothetical protein